MRQRFVGPALLQVLLRIDAGAPTGGYVLSLVDAAGTSDQRAPARE